MKSINGLPVFAFVFAFLSNVKADESPFPTSSPTYGSHCKRAGECIDLTSSKFCCTGKCKFMGTTSCGYKCMAADADDDFLSGDDYEMCQYHSRTPSVQPTTFQPTTSQCLRGGTCMTPNSTCCSGKCHNADQHCEYHYRCNDVDDDSNGEVQTNEYCNANLKKVHKNNDTNIDLSPIFLQLLIVCAYVFGSVLLVCILYTACSNCRKRGTEDVKHDNGDDFVYAPMNDNAMIDNTGPQEAQPVPINETVQLNDQMKQCVVVDSLA